MRGELDLVVRQQPPVALQRSDARGLEEREDPLRHVAHNAALALLHLRKIKAGTGNSNAVRSELLLYAVVELARLQQRLGGNAAGVQAGAAEGRAAIVVLPLIDAGDTELVLGSTDCGRVAGRAPTDDDDVETVGGGCGLAFVRHRNKHR